MMVIKHTRKSTRLATMVLFLWSAAILTVKQQEGKHDFFVSSFVITRTTTSKRTSTSSNSNSLSSKSHHEVQQQQHSALFSSSTQRSYINGDHFNQKECIQTFAKLLSFDWKETDKPKMVYTILCETEECCMATTTTTFTQPSSNNNNNKDCKSGIFTIVGAAVMATPQQQQQHQTKNNNLLQITLAFESRQDCQDFASKLNPMEFTNAHPGQVNRRIFETACQDIKVQPLFIPNGMQLDTHLEAFNQHQEMVKRLNRSYYYSSSSSFWGDPTTTLSLWDDDEDAFAFQ